MINDVNHLILIGTLGEDVKILETKNGEPMAILNIATNSEWIEGFEKKKRTLWSKVFFFGDQAQACMHYKKGMKVHVTAEVAEKQLSEGDFKTIITGLHVWVVDLGKSNRPSPEPLFDDLPF